MLRALLASQDETHLCSVRNSHQRHSNSEGTPNFKLGSSTTGWSCWLSHMYLSSTSTWHILVKTKKTFSHGSYPYPCPPELEARKNLSWCMNGSTSSAHSVAWIRFWTWFAGQICRTLQDWLFRWCKLAQICTPLIITCVTKIGNFLPMKISKWPSKMSSTTLPRHPQSAESKVVIMKPQ